MCARARALATGSVYVREREREREFECAGVSMRKPSHGTADHTYLQQRNYAFARQNKQKKTSDGHRDKPTQRRSNDTERREITDPLGMVALPSFASLPPAPVPPPPAPELQHRDHSSVFNLFLTVNGNHRL